MVARVLLALILSNFMNLSMKAQGSAGSSATLEPRYIVDLPTAGMLSHGSLAFDMDFYHSGGLLISTTVGVFDRVLLGISYGGAGILGNDRPEWNDVPGLAARLRVVEESEAFPAIAIGFESQGKEEYLSELDRYAYKSPGLYIVGSKNYDAMGYLSLHAGINYSLERGDGDTDPNVYFGAEKSVGSVFSVVGEYNLGLNDSDTDALGRGRGYLNLGVRATMGGGLSLSFNLKDITRNQEAVGFANRTLSLEYVRSL